MLYNTIQLGLSFTLNFGIQSHDEKEGAKCGYGLSQDEQQ